jgi:hypothetical protein
MQRLVLVSYSHLLDMSLSLRRCAAGYRHGLFMDACSHVV